MKGNFMKSWREPLKIFTCKQPETLPFPLNTSCRYAPYDVYSGSKKRKFELFSVSMKIIQLLLADVLLIKNQKVNLMNFVISLPCKSADKSFSSTLCFSSCAAEWEQFLVAIMLGHETNCVSLWGWKFSISSRDTATWLDNLEMCAVPSLSLDIYSGLASKLSTIFFTININIWFAPWHF